MRCPVVWLLTCHDGPGLVLYDVLYKLSVCKLECSPGPRLSESGPALLFYLPEKSSLRVSDTSNITRRGCRENQFHLDTVKIKSRINRDKSRPSSDYNSLLSWQDTRGWRVVVTILIKCHPTKAKNCQHFLRVCDIWNSAAFHFACWTLWVGVSENIIVLSSLVFTNARSCLAVHKWKWWQHYI